MDATLLFAERSPLSWKKSMYGYLLATDYACLGLSTLVILPLLIRCCHLADMTMVLVGVAFRAARLVIMATSSTTLGIYMAVLVGAPSSLIVSCGKALISKTVQVSHHCCRSGPWPDGSVPSSQLIRSTVNSVRFHQDGLTLY
jgi:hypothetical protein